MSTWVLGATDPDNRAVSVTKGIGTVADTTPGEHKGMYLILPKTKTGSNQSVRVIDPSVQTLLRQLVKETKRPNDFIFPFRTDQFQMKHVCAELGLSPLYVPHSLRHG